MGKGLSSQDIHALVHLPGGRLLASTNNDVNVSLDEGDTLAAIVRVPKDESGGGEEEMTAALAHG